MLGLKILCQCAFKQLSSSTRLIWPRRHILLKEQLRVSSKRYNASIVPYTDAKIQNWKSKNPRNSYSTFPRPMSGESRPHHSGPLPGLIICWYLEQSLCSSAMDGFLLGCSFVPWFVKGASQSMNIKIILDGKATCRHHGMTHKNVVLWKVVPIATTR
jgi:hypothetical protein